MSMLAMSAGICISCRRDETAYPARMLYRRLIGRFGDDQAFMDVDSIESGDDFAEIINDAVGSFAAFIALIGDRSLTLAIEDGKRRLDNAKDFVRLEIDVAIKRNIRVVPVLVKKAKLLSNSDLPPSLTGPARHIYLY